MSCSVLLCQFVEVKQAKVQKMFGGHYLRFPWLTDGGVVVVGKTRPNDQRMKNEFKKITKKHYKGGKREREREM